MVFSSYDFLFLFLPAVLLCYRLSPPARRNGVLVAASYFFYGYWNVRYVWLLFASSGINYLFGNAIAAAPAPQRRRLLLAVALCANLGLLFWFKYANFFLATVAPLVRGGGLAPLQLLLPIGISFFSFQGMSYVVDIYRGTTAPAKSFLDFSCYLTMFPQLIAGPVVRFREIAARLGERPFLLDDLACGTRIFIVGLAKKALLADSAAAIAASSAASPSVRVFALSGMIAFTLQIYFDFAGYSDMAMGLGRIFGFRFPENFRHPYQAKGISDFWRRWHMTLSYWFRDYLYIPLGGSRRPAFRARMNLLGTMALCGLWHGAAWTYVVWGCYHGLLLVAERPWRRQIAAAPAWLVVPLTTLAVSLGWVVFRAASLDDAWRSLVVLACGGPGGGATAAAWWTLGGLAAVLALCWIWPEEIPCDSPVRRAARDILLFLLLLASVTFIVGGGSSPFLYYQF